MNKDQIYTMTVDLLHEMFELDKSKITPQSNLYTELDIDSIDAVDIVVRLNQMTGKRIQPEVFRAVRTVQDVVDVLDNLLAENAT
ncbi:MAG TPA: acyl carrier protein [Gammaproteobacteria bacterium]|nr:acyl carrier protein [Gammaproteobacteria bacterium]